MSIKDIKVSDVDQTPTRGFQHTARAVDAREASLSNRLMALVFANDFQMMNVS